jgi:hypothetical protein
MFSTAATISASSESVMISLILSSTSSLPDLTCCTISLIFSADMDRMVRDARIIGFSGESSSRFASACFAISSGVGSFSVVSVSFSTAFPSVSTFSRRGNRSQRRGLRCSRQRCFRPQCSQTFVLPFQSSKCPLHFDRPFKTFESHLLPTGIR